MPTAPYCEGRVMAWLEAWAGKLRGGAAVGIQRDKHGNLLVRYRHPEARQPVAFVAHTDHPGFEITGWESAQMARATFHGGVAREYFKRGTKVALFDGDGQRVAAAQIARVGDWAVKEIFLKVAGGKPGASKKAIDQKKAVFGMWDIPPFQRRGNLLRARVCDDLMGVAAICAGIEQMVRDEARADVTGIFTRAEEVGFIGAQALLQGKLLPRKTIVISVENSKALAHARTGDGPVVRVGDRSSIFDPGVTAGLCAAAEQIARVDGKFRFQRRLMDGGSCEGTVFRLAGYRTGAICLPMGNYHNMAKRGKIGPESVDFRDWAGLVRLIVAFGREPGTQIAEGELKKRLVNLAASGMRKLLIPKN
ncbi:M20/M25/M40 family metallo-hydrolase [Kamptonema cortianum]|nr:M20/M25/M40 family metallo-hydrolase [Oscillatoria laete-virens]MDK3157943.1 M20/M25/M40 family metallo-hydrolase [Kamptonema cortianum]MDL5052777.1 M20/M25/M40 family metallo-hydrolase [Oscillatoria laete-virens NRMC-F 0139]